MATFAQEFMKIYDRKIANGETTFGRSGIRSDHFITLCINGDFVFPREEIELVCEKMKMTEGERELLLSFVKDE